MSQKYFFSSALNSDYPLLTEGKAVIILLPTDLIISSTILDKPIIKLTVWGRLFMTSTSAMLKPTETGFNRHEHNKAENFPVQKSAGKTFKNEDRPDVERKSAGGQSFIRNVFHFFLNEGTLQNQSLLGPT